MYLQCYSCEPQDKILKRAHKLPLHSAYFCVYIHASVCVYICGLVHPSFNDSQPQWEGSPAAASWDRGEPAGGGCYGNSRWDVMLISVWGSDAMSREVVVEGLGHGGNLIAETELPANLSWDKSLYRSIPQLSGSTSLTLHHQHVHLTPLRTALSFHCSKLKFKNLLLVIGWFLGDDSMRFVSSWILSVNLNICLVKSCCLFVPYNYVKIKFLMSRLYSHVFLPKSYEQK